MIEAGLVVVALALALAAAWGRPGLTGAVLVGTLLLVPATLPLPGSPTALLTVSRLVEAGALVGLVVAAGRGRLGPRALAAHPAMLPLLAYLGVIATTGLALADPGVSPVDAAYLWVTQAEQLVFLLLGLALGRTLPARRVLTGAAVALGGVALIAVVEALTGDSWAHELFRRTAPELLGTVPAGPLEPRAGALRVRAAGDFALQTGWVLAALLPVVVGAAALTWRAGLRRRAVALAALAPLVLVALNLTRSRSPLAAVVVLTGGLLLALAASLPRHRTAATLATVTAGGTLLLLLAPALAARLSPDLDQGSLDVRVARLPEVLALPTSSPLTGVGLGGIEQVSLPGLDTSYVLTYVETGAVAAALLLVAVLYALAGQLRGLLPPVSLVDAPDRLLALVCALGTVAFTGSALTMDTFQAQSSSRLTWLVVGVGLAAAERVAGPQPLPSPSLAPERVGLVALALVVGLAVWVFTPAGASARYVFATTSVQADVLGVSPGSFGRTLVVTACELAEEQSRGQDWEVTTCAEDGPPGWAVLRIAGPSRAAVASGMREVFTPAQSVERLRGIRVGPPAEGIEVGKPTAARVAPVVLPLLAAAAAVLVPGPRRRRERAGV